VVNRAYSTVYSPSNEAQVIGLAL